MPATPAPITMTSWCDLVPPTLLASVMLRSLFFSPCSFWRLLCFTIAIIRRLHLRQDVGINPLEINRKTLFESETLQIGLLGARPLGRRCWNSGVISSGDDRSLQAGVPALMLAWSCAT